MAKELHDFESWGSMNHQELHSLLTKSCGCSAVGTLDGFENHLAKYPVWLPSPMLSVLKPRSPMLSTLALKV